MVWTIGRMASPWPGAAGSRAAKFSTPSMPRNLPNPCIHESDIFAFAGALQWTTRPSSAQEKQPLRAGAALTRHGRALGRAFQLFERALFSRQAELCRSLRATTGRLPGDFNHYADCRPDALRRDDPSCQT